MAMHTKFRPRPNERGAEGHVFSYLPSNEPNYAIPRTQNTRGRFASPVRQDCHSMAEGMMRSIRSWRNGDTHPPPELRPRGTNYERTAGAAPALPNYHHTDRNQHFTRVLSPKKRSEGSGSGKRRRSSTGTGGDRKSTTTGGSGSRRGSHAATSQSGHRARSMSSHEGSEGTGRKLPKSGADLSSSRRPSSGQAPTSGTSSRPPRQGQNNSYEDLRVNLQASPQGAQPHLTVSHEQDREGADRKVCITLAPVGVPPQSAPQDNTTAAHSQTPYHHQPTVVPAHQQMLAVTPKEVVDCVREVVERFTKQRQDQGQCYSPQSAQQMGTLLVPQAGPSEDPESEVVMVSGNDLLQLTSAVRAIVAMRAQGITTGGDQSLSVAPGQGSGLPSAQGSEPPPEGRQSSQPQRPLLPVPQAPPKGALRSDWNPSVPSISVGGALGVSAYQNGPDKPRPSSHSYTAKSYSPGSAGPPRFQPQPQPQPQTQPQPNRSPNHSGGEGRSSVGYTLTPSTMEPPPSNGSGIQPPNSTPPSTHPSHATPKPGPHPSGGGEATVQLPQPAPPPPPGERAAKPSWTGPPPGREPALTSTVPIGVFRRTGPTDSQHPSSTVPGRTDPPALVLPDFDPARSVGLQMKVEGGEAATSAGTSDMPGLPNPSGSAAPQPAQIYFAPPAAAPPEASITSTTPTDPVRPVFRPIPAPPPSK